MPRAAAICVGEGRRTGRSRSPKRATHLRQNNSLARRRQEGHRKQADIVQSSLSRSLERGVWPPNYSALRPRPISSPSPLGAKALDHVQKAAEGPGFAPRTRTEAGRRPRQLRAGAAQGRERRTGVIQGTVGDLNRREGAHQFLGVAKAPTKTEVLSLFFIWEMRPVFGPVIEGVSRFEAAQLPGLCRSLLGASQASMSGQGASALDRAWS